MKEGRVTPFFCLYKLKIMLKDIGVKLSINNNDVLIKSPVRAKYDEDKNLTLTFKIGNKGQDEVKMIFDKRTYLDIKDE